MADPSRVFPSTSRMLDQVCRAELRSTTPEQWPLRLEKTCSDLVSRHPFLPDMARLELARFTVGHAPVPESPASGTLEANPSLQLLHPGWTGLPGMLEDASVADPPQPGSCTVLIWKHPRTGTVEVEDAGNQLLLALKVAVERLDPGVLARQNDVPVGVIDGALDYALRRGVLLQPPSALVRTPPRVSAESRPEDPLVTADTFTLQWHVTQRCDLSCLHCYDRTDRVPLTLDRGLAILDDFRTFCRSRRVTGQVTFTGGNPMLHPDFDKLYRAAHERHLQVAVLGNPMPRQRIEQMIGVTRPAFYQVSLEGLPEHNDAIRGQGHFQRTLAFLELLRELGVPNNVMLTLTRANMGQVLPLAELLQDKTDRLLFNRLALFGEGARLALPDPKDFAGFCRDYVRAAGDNPVLGLKDNLLNIAVLEQGGTPFGGCTGFGCGAAFNFLALLSDGEMHACRKFPSPVGNIFQSAISEIYDSPRAEQYRQGCTACRDCRLFSSCGGCLAVSAGCGLEPLQQRDPFCFHAQES